MVDPFPGQPFAKKHLVGKIVHYTPPHIPGTTSPLLPHGHFYRGCSMAVILDQHQPWEDSRLPLPVVRVVLLETTHEIVTREWHFALFPDGKHRYACHTGCPREFFIADDEVERWTSVSRETGD